MSHESSFRMADHRTPLIHDCWYVGALAHEVDRSLSTQRLLGLTVLFYRTEAGEPVALENRCVHRSFPLDKGRLEGDTVRCGYHGMRFDEQGRCAEMPSLPRAPAHAAVRSFPVRERGPMIWIWMGDPSKADDRLIPTLDWLESPDWATLSGVCEVDSNYVAMHENLLDHTHFPVLHGQDVGTEDLMRTKMTVREEGDRVIMLHERPDSPLPGIFAHIMEIPDRRVDSRSENCFESPAAHVSKSRFVDTPPGAPPRTFMIHIVHLFTPITQNRIRYWWFFSRSFRLADPALDGFLAAGVNKAFEEDRAALGWIQAIKDQAGNEPLPELSFAPDRAGMLMRKVLLRLAEA